MDFGSSHSTQVKSPRPVGGEVSKGSSKAQKIGISQGEWQQIFLLHRSVLMLTSCWRASRAFTLATKGLGRAESRKALFAKSDANGSHVGRDWESVVLTLL